MRNVGVPQFDPPRSASLSTTRVHAHRPARDARHGREQVSVGSRCQEPFLSNDGRVEGRYLNRGRDKRISVTTISRRKRHHRRGSDEI